MFNWVTEVFDKYFDINNYEELTETEASEYINRSVSTLRAYRSKREYKRVPEIPCHKKGGHYFYWRKDLDDWKSKRGME